MQRTIGLLGLDGKEVAGFPRQPVTFNPPKKGWITNASELSWGPLPGRPWTKIAAATIYDEEGNALFNIPLQVGVEAAPNDTVEFAKGALQVTTNDEFSAEIISGIPIVSVPSMMTSTVTYPFDGPIKVPEPAPKAEPIETYLEGWFVECPMCGQKVGQGMYHNCGEGK